MNYWLLTTEFPPIHGGGISTYSWHTAKMLSEAGNRVIVFINDYSINSSIREFPIKNVELIRFPPNQVTQGKALGNETRLSLEFAHVVEYEIRSKGVPDVIETQDYLGIGYYLLQKKYLLYPNYKDLRVVLTMHAPNFLYLEYNQAPYYKFPSYWIGEMEKASIRMADLVISPSNYLIKELEPRMSLTEKKPVRIFNPFKNEWTTGKIPKYDKGDVVFFGKLTPQKGCLEMLSYLKKMWDSGFDKTLSIIGGGDHFFYPVQEDMVLYLKKVYAPYINKGLIKFEGNTAPGQLKERLKKAHVIITPSIVDNLPYTVIEVMSMGKTVLSSENGGHTEIISHTKNGFIFKHEVPNSFESQLQSILNMNSSELEVIGKNAQETINRLTNYKIILDQKILLIDNIINPPKDTPFFPFIEPIERTIPLKSDFNTGEPNKLSVIIPYYNMGDFIEDTLDSLQRITYPNVEIILINDGSSDPKSINKLKEVENKYPITVYHKINEGLSHTRNFGASKGKGEFLAFLDADDTVSPNYYQRAIEILKHYTNVSFVGCWAQYFGESNDIWPTFNPEPPYLLLHNMINSSALIYKKDDFLAFGRNDPNLIYGMEDYDSVISMVKNGARGVSFPELWWQYRIRKDSMAQSFTKNKELYLYLLINRNHTSFFKTYGAELVNLLNQNDSGINFNNPTWPLEKSWKRKYFQKNGKFASIIKRNKILRNLAKRIYMIISN